jgi:hypothetical protein
MSKKLIVVCLALVVAAMSLPAYANSNLVDPRQGIVLGTWENSSGDGWYNYKSGNSIGTLPSTQGGTSFSQSPISVSTWWPTNGSYSLAVSPPSGWGQQLAVHSYTDMDTSMMQDFINSNTFAIDYLYDSGSWPGSTTYAQIYELSIQYGYYFNSTNNANVWDDVGGQGATTGKNGVSFTDTGNPYNPGALTLDNKGIPGTDEGGTWEWQYSGNGNSFLSQMLTWFNGQGVAPSNGYVNFIFALNSDQAGTYYFDNARLIPEPATIALLSLGGLALLRRKRA